MKPFRQYSGIAAPLMRDNVDTDAIIPSREMKQVAKTGLADGMFADWRYLYKGTRRCGPNPAFILNQPGFEDSSILLAGNNFGCGSSREHAVWALAEYGMRAIIAPGFGSIFFNNCIHNGILPIVLERAVVDRLAEQVRSAPTKNRIQIDLETQQVLTPDGTCHDFTIAPLARAMLLQGISAIDMTLQHREAIAQFKAADSKRRSWAYL